MQPREKVLASIVAGLLVLAGGWYAVGKVSGAFATRRARLDILASELRDKQLRQARGHAAAARLAEYEHRSLPSDSELARTAYQNWLVSLADKAKLDGVHIDANRGGSHKGIYYKLPFTVRARGTLERATQFLHAFYSANHLHLLREARFHPLEKSKELELSFTIEALVLPGADRKDALNHEAGRRLKAPDLKSYTEVIVRRDLFAAYVPPPPPRPVVQAPPPPPPKPAFDNARYAVLTAILEIDDAPQAWLSVKTTGEVLKLRPGDPLEVGAFKGRVLRIGVADIEVESAGQRRLVALGKSLTQADGGQ